MISEDHKQQDREEKRRELLAKGWNADIAEPCEKCDGEGEILTFRDPPVEIPFGKVYPHRHTECPPCLGTGVQP